MTTHIIEGKRIIFTDTDPHSTAEAEAYLARAAELKFADWVRGKQENAMNVWNTAMGWKGGSK